MKKFLLALLAIAGVAAFAPKAEAGQFARVYTRHGVVYAHKADLFGRCYTDRVAYNNYYGYRPSPRHHYGRNYYAPRYGRSAYYRNAYGHRAPRVAFGFGL